MQGIANNILASADAAAKYRPELLELHHRYVKAAAGPDTEENLRERVACWSRAKLLWQKHIDDGGGHQPPNSPDGGTPAAGEPARMAA